MSEFTKTSFDIEKIRREFQGKSFPEDINPSNQPFFKCPICHDTGFAMLYLRRVIGKAYRSHWKTDEAIRAGALELIDESDVADTPMCYSFARKCSCRNNPESFNPKEYERLGE